MNPGDEVIVAFSGKDHPGEVISHHKGWVMCRIMLDPVWDYGVDQRPPRPAAGGVRQRQVRQTRR